MNMHFTLEGAQTRLLEIIASVETGIYTAEEAVDELNDLKADSDKDGLGFHADYQLEDFQHIRKSYLSLYNLVPDYDPDSEEYLREDEDGGY
jgi:hypothetical protein